jgi:hypothetical protein
MDENFQDPMKGGLGGTSLLGSRRATVEPVFDDIKIKGTQVDAAEIVEGVVDDVEFEFLIGVPAAGQEVLRALEDPTVQIGEGFGLHCVLFGIEVVEVAEQKAGRVSEFSVGLHQSIQYFIGDSDVVAIILRGHP